MIKITINSNSFVSFDGLHRLIHKNITVCAT